MEPQAPPPPPPQPPAAPPTPKKKMGALGWVLIGCGGLLVLFTIVAVAVGIFAVNKTKEFATEFAENPIRKSAEIAIKANPDLELVSADDEAGTMTIRDKRSGEVATFDWSEIEQGRLQFESSKGATMKIDATNAGKGGVITMSDDEGTVTQTIGGGSDLPDWFPAYPGASEAQSTFSSTANGTRTEMFSFTVGDSVEDLMEWYEERLEDDGYELSKSTYSSNGIAGGNLSGKGDDGRTTMTLVFSETKAGTEVGVNYTERQ